jgi:hypothetical protein
MSGKLQAANRAGGAHRAFQLRFDEKFGPGREPVQPRNVRVIAKDLHARGGKGGGDR